VGGTGVKRRQITANKGGQNFNCVVLKEGRGKRKEVTQGSIRGGERAKKKRKNGDVEKKKKDELSNKTKEGK